MPNTSVPTKRGLFVAFEGLDGVGKTTISKALVQQLCAMGEIAIHQPFPDRTTKTGHQINDYLRGERILPDMEIHRLFADNRKEAMPSIRAALRKGTHVVCDRYAFSGVAYTLAKGFGATLDELAMYDKGIIAPDILIFLSGGPASRGRTDYGEEVYEQPEFQTAVAAAFGKVLEFTQRHHPKGGGVAEIKFIANTGSVAETVSACMTAIAPARALDAARGESALWCDN